jgi:hypothetical protein
MDGRAHAAIVMLCAALVAGATAAAGASTAGVAVLRPNGIGAVRFGTAKQKAVAELTHLFGTPAARGINTGCRPRYSEVEWGDLVAEFRMDRFSGFRFIKGGYPLTTKGSPRAATPAKTGSPRLATSTGISLGSTLAQLRAAYRSLQRVGADTWRAPNGLLFVDDAKRDPVRPTSHIIELKINTCGDF